MIIIETIMYTSNKLNYKLVQEKDGWWSIYRQNKYSNEYEPIIQAKTLEKAKDYCDLTEPIVVPLKEI